MTAGANWPLGPFTRHDGAIIDPDDSLVFTCPVTGAPTAWAAKDVFNPGAVVRDGKVHLLVRCEDRVGRYQGVSRIGLATSDDGITFVVEPEPVLFPDDDRWQPWEWPGGCEDPRVVEGPEGYVCCYSGFDGRASTLMVATSTDLRTWHKHGPAFAGTPYARRLSKSGSIITEVRDGRLQAARVRDRYWMYWGEGITWAATSDDLVHWSPVEFDPDAERYLSLDPATGSWDIHRVPGSRSLRPTLFPRPGRFDSLLTEPGPPAVRTDDGIVLIYNGANHHADGDPTSAPFAYQPGQALFDAGDPLACIAREPAPFLRVDGADRTGQVDNVCFAEALVLHQGRWILYVGMADSLIGCATAPARSHPPVPEPGTGG